jgi:hypothetical protein
MSVFKKILIYFIGLIVLLLFLPLSIIFCSIEGFVKGFLRGSLIYMYDNLQYLCEKIKV